MYRFLLTRQWVILTLVALVLMPTMIKLGFWQLHRHQHKVAQNALIGENLKATPVPVEDLTAPGHTVPHDEYWRQVTATGHFDTADEVVVRRRTSSDGTVGYHVLTPFVLTNGKTVLINRGWIPDNGSQMTLPKIPAAPKGDLTVTGRLMADQTTAASGIRNVKGLPPRQVMLISSAQQAKALGRPVLGGYIEQTAPEPRGDSPELIPTPEHSDIGPHMAYAVQWWLFTAGVPIGWVVLVRREKRDRTAAGAKSAPEPVPAAA
ncbi:SURF1 family protein [Streptomyces sp. NBC_01387]|uniref:SURF1 family cytochrome oxidase biogenesis protein n=1 Tax=unclassified Streptomyces TaxID=2593676 RepID=UPI002024F8A3|nr:MULTISPECIES: SURF1 family protein [unclassified Streptomyces]MCX4551890.1 SURF1 family protein [Streptomyces sp. NBC_01500]WSC23253.1 SURF1 family protein [Streptomyces sp. NBC_01766]WSV57164.1 SURF1 family protein [Streptomyces sp. NBC_01014]